jgi:chromosome segregation ATPase
MLQKINKYTQVLTQVLILFACVPEGYLCAAELTAAERDLALKRRDFRNLLGDFSLTLNELESTKADFEQEKNRSREFAAGLQAVGDKLACLEAELVQKQATQEELRQQLAQERCRSQWFANKAVRTRAASSKANREKNQLINKLLRENQAVMAMLTSQKNLLEQEVERLKQELDTNFLLAQNQALIKQQQRLTADFKQANKQADELKQYLVKAKTQLSEKYLRDTEAVNRKLEALEADFLAKKRELQALSKTYASIRDENVALKTNLAILKDENRTLRAEGASVTLRFLQDRVDIEHNLSKKLLQVRELALSKTCDKQKQCERLSNENSALSTRLTNLEQQNNVMGAMVTGLEQKLGVAKTTAGAAANKLFAQLTTEQRAYLQKLSKIKDLVSSQVVHKDQKLVEFGEKAQQMMTQLVDQKRKYAQVFEELQLAQASLQALKARQREAQTATPEDKQDQKLARHLAKNVARLEDKIAQLKEKERGLFKELELAKNESLILKSSIDEMYASNEKLLKENGVLKTKFEASENTLLMLKDQTRELSKREAELIEKVINFENQVETRGKAGKQVSAELDQKLQLARADYAKLKVEVQTLVDKLTSSSQLVTSLSKEASLYKEKVDAVTRHVGQKEEQLEGLKAKVRTLLSNIGLQDDLLGGAKKVEYLRLVADYQLERLTESVLISGKGKMEDSLQLILSDDLLVKRMVDRLARHEQQLRSAASQSNFGQIFSSIQKNKVRAEISKLYGLFLARASTGKGEDESFKTFRKLVATHFSDPEVEGVEAKQLADPGNLIMQKIQW